MAETRSRDALQLAGLKRRRPLSARNALRAATVVAAVHGAVLLTAPGLALDAFDAPRAGDAGYWVRQYAILFVALAIVFAAATRWPSSMVQRPVMWAAAVMVTALAFAGGMSILDGSVGAAYGAVVGVEATLAIWLTWLLIADHV